MVLKKKKNLAPSQNQHTMIRKFYPHFLARHRWTTAFPSRMPFTTESSTEIITPSDNTTELPEETPTPPPPTTTTTNPTTNSEPAAAQPPRRAMALPAVTPDSAMEQVVTSAKAKFDETIELSLGLGIDPRKPNQQFRTMAQLPHGSGKTAIIAVFAQGDAADRARAAGATVVGAEDLVADIQAGNINFSRCIATPGKESLFYQGSVDMSAWPCV